MLDFLKRRNKSSLESNTNGPETPFFSRFKTGLLKTKHRLQNQIRSLLSEKVKIDDACLESLEEILISADLGYEVSAKIIQKLKTEFQVNAKQNNLNNDLNQNLTQNLTQTEILETLLKKILIDRLLPYEKSWNPDPTLKPAVILVVGINGSGKTTSIAKLAKYYQDQGNRILLAAGDTYRAAAVSQLKEWGTRANIPVIAQDEGADSASVIFDALQAAKARETDLLIADTAGRLHTQSPLMEELKKIVRVMKKLDPAAPHEVLLVLDAGLGQNALNQAKTFNEALKLTGIILTKLDGTAKGGIIFNITETLQCPVRFIGLGEGMEDLQAFKAREFVEALFN